MRNHGNCIINVKLAETHDLQVNPLVIDYLSYTLILGKDFIKFIDYSKKNNYVVINDVPVK